MKVMFACLADHAGAEQMGNKLNVMGIFDRIAAHQFPVTHQKMFLVLRMLFEHEDNNKTHKLVISLRDADHKEFSRLEAELQSGSMPAGEFVATNQIIELVNVAFAKPGRYHFAIRANSEEEVRVPFAVVKA